MENTRVSIIMPSYNSAQYIAESIESIIAQSYTDWELIICDDASSDNTVEIIEKFIPQDNRIKLLRLLSNQGAAVARNRALDYAVGRYIAFCDSDDRWRIDKLAKQLEFMKAKGVKVCYSSYIECNEVGENMQVVVARKRLTLHEMVNNDYMGFLTLIYDTQGIGKVSLPALRKRQDWAMKLQLMQRVQFAMGVLEPLAYYRVRHDSLSHSKMGLIKYNVMVYREILKWGMLRAWMVMIFIFLPHYFLKKTLTRLNNR